MWKVSGIHRNTLRNSLKELIKQRLILKHKYLENVDPIKIKEKIYHGRLYKNPYSNFPPLFKRNYYILNYNDFKEFENETKYIDYLIGNTSDFEISVNDIKYEFQYQDLIKRYYFNNRINHNEKTKIDINNYPQLSNLRNKINELKLKPKNIDFKKFDYTEQIIYSIRYLLRYTALVRKLELSAVNERVLLSLLPIDKYTKQLDECKKFFSNQDMSNADIIIRCSTECCWLNINNSFVFLPMIDYECLLYDFFDIGRDLL